MSVAAILYGCGGGGGGGGDPPSSQPQNATPSIQNLQYSPKDATYNTILGNSTANISATLDYVDSDGVNDVDSIIVSTSNGQNISIPRSQLSLNGIKLSATITISIVQPATTILTVHAKDKAGNLSNTLQGAFKTAYETTSQVTISQNDSRTNFAVSWGESPPYPGCARQINQTFTFVSATRNGCGNINSFTATLPDGTSSTWNSYSGQNCPGGGSTVGAGSPITINSGGFRWVDSATNSTFTLTFPGLLDVHVNCS